jgi:hypothetical protein
MILTTGVLRECVQVFNSPGQSSAETNLGYQTLGSSASSRKSEHVSEQRSIDAYGSARKRVQFALLDHQLISQRFDYPLRSGAVNLAHAGACCTPRRKKCFWSSNDLSQGCTPSTRVCRVMHRVRNITPLGYVVVFI